MARAAVGRVRCLRVWAKEMSTKQSKTINVINRLFMQNTPLLLEIILSAFNRDVRSRFHLTPLSIMPIRLG